MTPIELIKEGIMNNDMEKVAQAYSLLTGEKVGQGEGQPATEEVSEPQVPEPQVSGQKEKSKDLDFSVEPREDQEAGHYTKSEAIQVGENQFVDNGTESTDVTTPDVPRSTRRPPVKMVEVECHVCGSKEEVNAEYTAGDFHRCDKCVGG